MTVYKAAALTCSNCKGRPSDIKQGNGQQIIRDDLGGGFCPKKSKVRPAKGWARIEVECEGLAEIRGRKILEQPLRRAVGTGNTPVRVRVCHDDQHRGRAPVLPPGDDAHAPSGRRGNDMPPWPAAIAGAGGRALARPPRCWRRPVSTASSLGAGGGTV